MPKSQYEIIFARQLERAGLEFEREYRFHPERKWRFDFANPDLKLAFEVHGAIWTRGRHTRGYGFIGDCEKAAEANLRGWYVYGIPAPWIAIKRGRRYVEQTRGIELAKRAVATLSR